MESSCGVIIPVYNEARVIQDTINKVKNVIGTIPNWKFEIVCVNDGSSDDSGKILDSIPGIHVLHHQANRGYGAALRTGLNYSKNEWIFIVDADATYPIEDLGRLIEETKKGADMVVGARKGIGINLSPFRRLARWILRKMSHMLTGVMVPDLNSGMRIFKRKLYKEFKGILPLGFSFTTTITLASLYSSYKIIYIPITYNRRVGKSNIKPVRDFLGFTMLIVRIASYFEPLRFFLPLALLIILSGVLKGARDFYYLGHIGALAVTLCLAGLQVFITGILADVIVKRSYTDTDS